MKESKYNMFFKYKENTDQKIIYNTRTNALGLMDKEHLQMFDSFIKYGTEISDQDFVKTLSDSGYLIGDEVDELTLLRYNMFRDRFNTNHLGLTIAPTSNCNFRCPYCYEKENLGNDYMSDEIQEKIYKFVEDWSDSINLLSIDWYGGEPLLAMKQITWLSEKFIDLCNKKGIEYYANIVTNGYALTAEVAKELNRLKVLNVQITLDGPEEIHNKRRPLMNGGATFSKIVSNIKESVDYLSQITVRVNTDNENQDRIDEVFDILKENNLSDKVRVYLGFIQSTDSYNEEKCMSTELFSKRNFKFIMDNGINIINTYPRLMTCFCSADSLNNYVIDPEGNFYKCWEDIGKKEMVLYNIKDDLEGKQVDTVCKSFCYMMFDPTNDEECRNCNCLPICMGGCPNKRRLSRPVCEDKKYSLEEYLGEYVNYIIKNREKKKQ